MTISANLVSVLIGVVSGIITALLIWFLNIIFQKIILPWFEEFVYRGVNVSGNWIYSHKDDVSQIVEIRMELEQKAHRIFGKFQAKTSWPAKNEEYTNYYSIAGSVKDNYLLFTYEATRKDRTGVGAFLLRASHGGTELIGNAIYTPDGNTYDASIVARKDIVFKRNN